MLTFGASTDDVCAGCGHRGQVAWLSGDMALTVSQGEDQPRIRAVNDLSLQGAPTTTGFMDLYLCGSCIRRAASRVHVSSRRQRASPLA